MSVATVSSKGQITLPVEARRALDLAPGDRVLVLVVDGRIVIEPALDFLTLQGVLGPALSADQEEDEQQRAAGERAALVR